MIRKKAFLSTNHLSNGYDYEYFAYNFTGQLIKKKHVHKGYTEITEYYAYTYDHAGRPLVTTHF